MMNLLGVRGGDIRKSSANCLAPIQQQNDKQQSQLEKLEDQNRSKYSIKPPLRHVRRRSRARHYENKRDQVEMMAQVNNEQEEANQNESSSTNCSSPTPNDCFSQRDHLFSSAAKSAKWSKIKRDDELKFDEITNNSYEAEAGEEVKDDSSSDPMRDASRRLAGHRSLRSLAGWLESRASDHSTTNNDQEGGSSGVVCSNAGSLRRRTNKKTSSRPEKPCCCCCCCSRSSSRRRRLMVQTPILPRKALLLVQLSCLLLLFFHNHCLPPIGCQSGAASTSSSLVSSVIDTNHQDQVLGSSGVRQETFKPGATTTTSQMHNNAQKEQQIGADQALHPNHQASLEVGASLLQVGHHLPFVLAKATQNYIAPYLSSPNTSAPTTRQTTTTTKSRAQHILPEAKEERHKSEAHPEAADARSTTRLDERAQKADFAPAATQEPWFANTLHLNPTLARNKRQAEIHSLVLKLAESDTRLASLARRLTSGQLEAELVYPELTTTTASLDGGGDITGSDENEAETRSLNSQHNANSQELAAAAAATSFAAGTNNQDSSQRAKRSLLLGAGLHIESAASNNNNQAKNRPSTATTTSTSTTRSRHNNLLGHYNRTHALIQAFNYKFRFELELNDNLFGPGLVQKHYLANGVQQISTQRIEPCFFHGRTRQADMPRGLQAIAAFRACNGLSGIIHVDNESFVIQPLLELSSDQQQQQHVTSGANGAANQQTATGSMSHQKKFQQPHIIYRYQSSLAPSSTANHHKSQQQARNKNNNNKNNNNKKKTKIDRECGNAKLHDFALKQYNKFANVDQPLEAASKSSRSADKQQQEIMNDDATLIDVGESQDVNSLNRTVSMLSSMLQADQQPSKRDIILTEKYLELGLVLSRDMFDKRVNSSRQDVINDAIQIINCLDLYFKHSARTRVSLTYLETWAHKDRIEINRDVKKTLYNFLEYSTRRLYMVAMDAVHLITGGHSNQFESDELGMSIPDSICSARAVSVSQEASIYEPFVVGSIMAHMIGHNLGMEHDNPAGSNAKTSQQQQQPPAEPTSAGQQSRQQQLATSISSGGGVGVIANGPVGFLARTTSGHNKQSHQPQQHQHHREFDSESQDTSDLDTRGSRSAQDHQANSQEKASDNNNNECRSGNCLMSERFTYFQSPVSFGHLSSGNRTKSSNSDDNQDQPEYSQSFVDPLTSDNSELSSDDQAAYDADISSDGDANANLSEAGDSTTTLQQDFALPFKFSRKSLDTYHKLLRLGHGVCLFNKPNQLEDFKLCGNGIVDRGEDCDCGNFQQCQLAQDQCCDPITCRFRSDAECITGACCDRCRLKQRGSTCRKSRNECDLTEWCDGKSPSCPADLYKADGRACSNGYCHQGHCPTLDDQCADIWGQEAKSADIQCYTTFNTLGSARGNCGASTDFATKQAGKQVPSSPATSSSATYKRCELDNVQCGSVQCKSGDLKPLFADYQAASSVNGQLADSTSPLINHSRKYTPTADGSSQYECKSLNGHYLAYARDGTKCGEQRVCQNKTCVNVEYAYRESMKLCPRDEQGHECSGNGWCSSAHRCHCELGWAGHDCSQIWPVTSSSDQNSGTETQLVGDQIQSEPSLGNISSSIPVKSPGLIQQQQIPESLAPAANQQYQAASNGKPNANIQASSTPAPVSSASNATTTTTPASVVTTTTTTTQDPIKKKAEGLGRTHLVLILVTIVAAVYIGFALMANCYRRNNFYKPDKVLRHHQMSCKLESMRSSFIERRLADAKAVAATAIDPLHNLHQHNHMSHNGPGGGGSSSLWATTLGASQNSSGQTAPLLANDDTIDFMPPGSASHLHTQQNINESQLYQQERSRLINQQQQHHHHHHHHSQDQPQKIAATVHYYTSGGGDHLIAAGQVQPAVGGSSTLGANTQTQLDQPIFDIDRIPLIPQAALNSRFHLIPLEQHPSTGGVNLGKANNNNLSQQQQSTINRQSLASGDIVVNTNTRCNSQNFMRSFNPAGNCAAQPLPLIMDRSSFSSTARSQRLNRAISLGNVNNSQMRVQQLNKGSRRPHQPQSYTTICWPETDQQQSFNSQRYNNNKNMIMNLDNDQDVQYNNNNYDRFQDGYASDEEFSYEYQREGINSGRRSLVRQKSIVTPANLRHQHQANSSGTTPGSAIHRAFATPLRSSSPRRMGSLGRDASYRMSNVNSSNNAGYNANYKSTIGTNDDSYSAPSSPEARSGARHRQQQQHGEYNNKTNNHDEDPMMLISSLSNRQQHGNNRNNLSNYHQQSSFSGLGDQSTSKNNNNHMRSAGVIAITGRANNNNNKLNYIGRHQSLDERIVAADRSSSLDGDAEEDDDDPLSELPLPPPPLRADFNEDNDDDDDDEDDNDIDYDVEDSTELEHLNRKHDDNRPRLNNSKTINDHTDPISTSGQVFVKGPVKKQQLTLNDLGDQLSLIAQLQQLDSVQKNQSQVATKHDNHMTSNQDHAISSKSGDLHEFFSLPLVVQLSALLATKLQNEQAPGSSEPKQSSSTETTSSITVDEILNLLNTSNTSANASRKILKHQNPVSPGGVSVTGASKQASNQEVSTSSSRVGTIRSTKAKQKHQANKLQNLRTLISTLQNLSSGVNNSSSETRDANVDSNSEQEEATTMALVNTSEKLNMTTNSVSGQTTIVAKDIGCKSRIMVDENSHDDSSSKIDEIDSNCLVHDSNNTHGLVSQANEEKIDNVNRDT